MAFRSVRRIRCAPGPSMYCARHDTADASWECLRCARLHCEACVRRVGNERKTVAACAHCDGLLRVLEVEVVQPAAEARRGLFGRVFTSQGLLTVSLVGIFAGLARMPMPIFNLAFGVLYLCTGAGAYYAVVEHVARGRPGFPAPAEADSLPAQVQVARGLLGLLCFFVGFGLWFAARPGAENLDELVVGHGPTTALLVALGTVWAFTGVLAMINADSGLAAFWPPTLVRVVARAPRAFAVALGQAAALTTTCVLGRLAVAAGLGAWPMLAGLATGVVTAVLLFMQAALQGGHIRSNHLVYGIRR